MRDDAGMLLVANCIRIGTRKSAMALVQTQQIARRLTAAISGLEVEVVKFATTGDIDQTSKLLPHGGKGGAFVAQIRNALLAGELHAAMHSLKDMPGNEDTPSLVIGATLPRDPPGDVLVLRSGISFDELKRTRGKGFKIGTNAVRRAAYARRLFHQMAVPEVDEIDGLPPAVALQQQRGSPTTRSSVGSVTTLSNLLRMLYSRAGDYPRGAARLEAEAFSPNTPAGACPECHGLGRIYTATEASMVPDDTKTIRARAESRGGSVPALALTAYASEVDRERALAAGYQQHLAKPVDPQSLVAVIAALAGRAAAATD